MVHSGLGHSHAAAAATIVALPTELHKAAHRNDAGTITMLLRGGGMDPNSRVECPNCDEGATALHFAAQQGHLEAVLALLDGGARPGGRDSTDPGRPRSENNRAVSGSSSSSYEEWDISDSDDVSEQEHDDLTPLHLACVGGHTAVVQALLSAGEPTDRLASGRKVSDHAAVHGNNAAPDHSGGTGGGVVPHFFGGVEGGHTPLHLASACGAAGAVRALVGAGACVHRREGDCDDTPLHLASAAGHVEAMAALLAAGADINAGDEIGNTPLHVARDAETLEFLLYRGANPNLVAMSRYGGGTPLGSYCTLIHRLETDDRGMRNATAKVEALLRYGASVHIRPTTAGDLSFLPHASPATVAAASPILSCAAKNGVPGIVSALLGAGLDPNERDRDGWAPIHDAVQGDHVDVLRLLLRAGAERDAPTRSGGWTPLHLACRYTSVECVVELLRWNASLGAAERPLSSFTARAEGSAVHRPGNNETKPIFGVALEDYPPEEDEEEEENGYGKTPAEVVGLKNLAAASTGPADSGGSGHRADPSLDEEEEQMVVFGDDDEETGDRNTGVGERNAIRRALRREAAWRRRRGAVLVKVYLVMQRQLEGAAATAAPTPWAAVPNDDGGDGFSPAARVKRKGSVRDDARVSVSSVQPPGPAAEMTAGGGVGDERLLQGALEGLVGLAEREEALFREIVMCL
ncbi:unnamed protein product [Ectocarpus sp. 6 AP-2014]